MDKWSKSDPRVLPVSMLLWDQVIVSRLVWMTSVNNIDNLDPDLKYGNL